MTEDSALRFKLDPPLDADLRSALISLWADVVNAGGEVGFVPPVGAQDIAPVAHASFERISAARDHLVVAYEDSETVGFGFLIARPGPLFAHWMTIKRLMVDPARQGCGYGSALLNALHEAAAALELEQIHLTVRGGTGTEAFYERHGYSEICRIPEAIRVAPGDDREEIYMVLRL